MKEGLLLYTVSFSRIFVNAVAKYLTFVVY